VVKANVAASLKKKANAAKVNAVASLKKKANAAKVNAVVKADLRQLVLSRGLRHISGFPV
jgi:uncharacterized protein YbjQ (UPF0145 family)